MKRLFFAVALLAGTVSAFAQETPPPFGDDALGPTANHDTVHIGKLILPRGLYDTWDQVQKGRPSNTGKFAMVPVPVHKDQMSAGRLGDARLDSVKGLEASYLRKVVFAVSTGEDFYLNVKTSGPDLGFRKVLNQGPVLLMESQDPDVQPGASGGLIGFAVANQVAKNDPNYYKYRQAVAYDPRTAKFIIFTAKRMREFLAATPDILAKFEAEERAGGAGARTELYSNYVEMVNLHLRQQAGM